MRILKKLKKNLKILIFVRFTARKPQKNVNGYNFAAGQHLQGVRNTGHTLGNMNTDWDTYIHMY